MRFIKTFLKATKGQPRYSPHDAPLRPPGINTIRVIEVKRLGNLIITN